MGVAGNHDGDDVGVEDIQVFEQLQTIVAGAEVPVEDGQVDGVPIGQPQRLLGAGSGQDGDAQARLCEPLAEVRRTGSSSSTISTVSGTSARGAEGAGRSLAMMHGFREASSHSLPYSSPSTPRPAWPRA